MSVFGKVATLFLVIVSTLLVIVLVRTFTLHVKQADVLECQDSDLDFIPASEEVVERFRTALRYQTVSFEPHEYRTDELLKLVNFIKQSFPAIHTSKFVQHEIVANYSLLYKIKGSNSSLMPYLLMAHLDVVPAEADKWELPPFNADIKDGFIYARGTIDFKQGVMGILEALNFVIQSGKQPVRGFYVAFGHDEEFLFALAWNIGFYVAFGPDEEVTGEDGSEVISDLLWARGVRQVEFILDEGLTLTNHIVPGMKEQVALIGSSEKGQVYVELSVEGEPGHSSMPPRESTIGILAGAISRLEKYPQPSMMGYGPEVDTFEHLSPYMTLPYRIVMSNLWLFKPVVSWVMSLKPATNAITRTVTAVTMFNAGIKINVNAPVAKAHINHRIHPAQTIQDVLDYDRSVINDDRVKLRILKGMEAHPMSPTGEEDFGFQTVKNSIRQVWRNTYVAPGTMIGNTDTRHYLRFTNNVYRFSPTILFPADTSRFHGDNERISIKNYEQAVNFYYHVMMNANAERIAPSHHHREL